MIKRTMPVALSALLVTMTSVHAYTLYEEKNKKVELTSRVSLERYASKDRGEEGDQSSVRLGLKGEEPLEKDTTVKLFTELELSKELAGEAITVRTALIGIKGDGIGTLSYGRTLAVMNDITDFTDQLPLASANALGNNDDRFGTGRSTGLLQYRSQKTQGIQLALQYLAKNSAKESKEPLKDAKLKKSNGDGYGVAVTHDIGTGITWGVAFNNEAKSRQQRDYFLNDKRATMIALGAKYDGKRFYLGGAYAETRNQLFFENEKLDRKSGAAEQPEKGIYANKTQGFEMVAQYKFPNGLKPTIGYFQSKATLKNDCYHTKEKNVNFVDVGIIYDFNKQFSVSADYKINLLKKKGAEKLGNSVENILGLGLTYTF
jgi:outer membrane pore protein F